MLMNRPANKINPPTKELTLRGILLAVVLTVLLAISNAYLALKLGILTSASIPAAMLSMAILHFFKNHSVLENNLVQTAASAGEAVAGGIVYTIPALIIIHYWYGFDYWTNVLIAASGGVLGVLFSVPLRRLLVNEPALAFPEGRAIAEVLNLSAKQGVGNLLLGGFIGGGLEMLQAGLKVITASWYYWFVFKRTLIGFGIGFSATMIGAGYLMGHHIALSIFLGTLLVWLVVSPLVSNVYPELLQHYPADQAARLLWDNELRYLGIGAMLFAGIWTFARLARPLFKGLGIAIKSKYQTRLTTKEVIATDKDMPYRLVIPGIILVAVLLVTFFYATFPTQALQLSPKFQLILPLTAIGYILIIGFLFSVITGYLSGMVGVSASPGSAIVIAGMLLAAWLLLTLMTQVSTLPFGPSQIKAAEAITIIIGAIVTGIAAIANDNSQDLKVGQLVGSTPWKQQLMLLLGVMISALIIPAIMQLLFNVYGIAGVMPHANMDTSLTLPAPTAALMAAITEAVFNQTIPWIMMGIGAMLVCVSIVILYFCRCEQYFKLSPLGLAMGMYLPQSSSFPLVIGGLVALVVQRSLTKKSLLAPLVTLKLQTGILIACGLVAGSALVDVILAIFFSIYHSPDALTVVGPHWGRYGIGLAVVSTLLLALWIKHQVVRSR